MGYKITLLNSIFDRHNDNVILFDNIQQRETYFENIADKQVFENINFEAKNIINTSIVLTLQVGLSLIKLLNYNYCIVENQDINEDKLFYFVEESRQLDGPMIRLSLNIDYFMTYWYRLRNVKGLINRTHLDRYIPVYRGATSEIECYTYDFREKSALFEREGLSVAKRPTENYKLETEISTGVVDNWLKENVSHWVYYYLSAGKSYVYGMANGGETATELDSIKYKTFTEQTETSYEDGQIVVLVAPVYKTSKRIKIHYLQSAQKGFTEWSESAISDFLRTNNNFADVYAIKNSLQPPIYADGRLASVCSVNSNGDLEYNNTTFSDWGNNLLTGYQYLEDCVDFARGEYTRKISQATIFGRVIYQDLTKPTILKSPRGLYPNLLTREELLEDSTYYEPKLYNEEVSVYRLYIGGQSYELPVSKSNAKPCFYYKEVLSPDITKAMLIYSQELSEKNYRRLFGTTIYTEINEKDFTGFMIQVDLSRWFTQDDLSTFLATNKNNLQIFNNTQNQEAWSTLVSGLGGVAKAGAGVGVAETMYSMKPSVGAMAGVMGAGAGLLGTGVGMLASGINLMIQQNYARANRSLTLDNMAQSPERLSALNSNALLMSSVNELGIYIEIQEPITFEREIIVDNLKLNGYTFNKIGLLTDYIKTRKFYNYIEATIFDIDSEIAEQVKDGIIETFAKGIRVWHFDNWVEAGSTINYSVNNVERRVENGN